MSSSGDELFLAVVQSPPPSSQQPGTSGNRPMSPGSSILQSSPLHPVTSSPIQSDLLLGLPFDISNASSNVSDISWMSGAEGDVSDFFPSLRNSPTFMRRFHLQRLADLKTHKEEIQDMITHLQMQLSEAESQIISHEEKVHEINDEREVAVEQQREGAEMEELKET